MDRLRTSLLSKTVSSSDNVDDQKITNIFVLEILSNHGNPNTVAHGGLALLDGQYRELKIRDPRIIGTNERIRAGPWECPWPPTNAKGRIGIRFTVISDSEPAILRIWPSETRDASVREVVLYKNDIPFCRREVGNALPISIALKTPDIGLNETFYDSNRAALDRMWSAGIPFVATRVLSLRFTGPPGTASISFLRLWDADGNSIETHRVARVSTTGITSKMDPRYAFLEVKPKHFDEEGNLLEEYEFAFEATNEISLEFPELYAIAAMEMVVKSVAHAPPKMSIRVNGKIAWVGPVRKWIQISGEESSRFIVFLTEESEVVRNVGDVIRHKRLVDPIVLEMKRNAEKSSLLVEGAD